MVVSSKIYKLVIFDLKTKHAENNFFLIEKVYVEKRIDRFILSHPSRAKNDSMATKKSLIVVRTWEPIFITCK